MPAAPPSVMASPRSPGAQVPFAPTARVAPSSVMMPTTVDATPQFLAPAMDTAAQYLPVAEAPTSPFAFFGGFAGGLAVGVAFVYSLLQRTGQKLSDEARKLEQEKEAQAAEPYSLPLRMVSREGVARH